MHSENSPCELAREAQLEAMRTGQPLDASINAHIASCALCQAVQAKIAPLLAEVEARRTAELSDEVEDRVLLRLRPQWAAHAESTARARPWFSRPIFGWSAGVLAATVIAIVAWSVSRSTSPGVPLDQYPSQVDHRLAAHFSKVSVGARVMHGDQAAIEAELEQAVGEGDSVVTSSAGPVEVRLGPERVAISASSRLGVRSLAVKNIALSLEAGTLVAEVEPGAKDKHFHVHTPHAEVTVTGTIFEVNVTSNGTGVSVARGSVLVEPVGQAALRVEAGERVWVEGGLARRETLDAEARARVVASFEAASATAPDAAQPLVKRDPAPLLPSRKIIRRPHAARNAALDALLDADNCAEAEKALAASGARAPADVRAGSAVEVGDCFYSRGERESALRVYREAADRFPATLAGANARYEVGRVASQLGNRLDAIAAFTAYAAQYPKAALAPEALFRACSFEYEEGQLQQSLACLTQYQARYAHGRRSAEAALLEATLLRTVNNDCAGAIAAYDVYLKTPGPQEKEARQWRDWCARRR